MLITEVAVQNIVGFPATARVPLKAGLNAFVAKEADLLQLVRAVLFPSPTDVATLCVPGAKPHKAALTITGRDGHTYRLVRDFDGGRALLRSDPATRQAHKIADDPIAVADALQDPVGLPGAAAFDTLMALAAGALPSRAVAKPAARATSEVTLPPNATSFGALDAASLTVEDARRKLPELQEELDKAVRFEEAQDALYGLQNRMSELARGTEGVDEIERQIAEFDGKLKAFAGAKEVTAGVEARIKKFPEAAARRDGAISELNKKRADYEAHLAVPPDFQALLRSQFFSGGLAGGLACIVGAVVFELPWLWALDLVGFGVAAFGAWKWVDDVEEADRGRRRLTDLADLEKRIHRQYEIDTQPVLAAIKALGVNTADEVLHRLDERDMLDARRQALVRDLEQRRADPTLLALEQERQAVERDLRSREAIVNGMGFTRDPGIIRRDVQACEEVLSRGGPSNEPLADAVSGAAIVAGVEPRVIVESLKDRLTQYMTALTDRRFSGIRQAGPATWHVVATGGASGPLDGLPAIDRDLIYVAVRLALAERACGPGKVPVFFDEPSLLMDAAHRALFVKMLKSLGALTQVVVRAFDAPPAALVDHIAKAGATQTTSSTQAA